MIALSPSSLALALAVKPVSVALLPGVLWALAVAPGARAGARWPAVARRGASSRFVVVPGGPRRFASYLWQFYLPVRGGQRRAPAARRHGRCATVA